MLGISSAASFLPHSLALLYLMLNMDVVNFFSQERVYPVSHPCFLFHGNSPVVSHLTGEGSSSAFSRKGVGSPGPDSPDYCISHAWALGGFSWCLSG